MTDPQLLAHRSPPASIAEVVARLDAADPPDSLLDGPHRDHARARLDRGPLAWAAATALSTTRTLARDRTTLAALRPTLLRLSMEALLVDMLLELCGHPALTAHSDPIHGAVTRRTIALDLPADAMSGKMRNAQRHWTDRLLGHAIELGAGPALINEIVLTLSGYFDRFVDARAAFRAEVLRERTDVGGPRRRLVERLLNGDDVDPARARRWLGIDLGQVHVACVASAHPRGAPFRGAVFDVADRVAADFGADSLLRHDGPGGSVWLWFSRAGDHPGAALSMPDLSDRGARVGIGSAQPGALGFRRSLLEALDAVRVAETAGLPAPVRHGDVALVALLSLDPERARWFVSGQLGPLAGAGREMRELRETLLEFYRCGQRPVTTAARLHMHRNTLSERLQRITGLVGRPLTGDAAALRSALVLRDTLGDAPSAHAEPPAGPPGRA